MLFKLDDDLKDVPGTEGRYQVHRDGYISRNGKRLKPYVGSVSLSLCGEVISVRVAELVAQAFLEGYEKGDKIYFIDGTDNCAALNLSLKPVARESEDWRFIPGTNNYYQASRSGEIRSVDRTITSTTKRGSFQSTRPGRVLKQTVNKNGYLSVIISVDGHHKLKSVHRLVATTFLPNPDNLPQINHIDGNKTNNCVENLEWCTQSRNMGHAKEHGLWSPVECGKSSRLSTGIPVRCITDGKEYSSINQAAKTYCMDFESVKESIKTGRPRKGFQFEYI